MSLYELGPALQRGIGFDAENVLDGVSKTSIEKLRQKASRAEQNDQRILRSLAENSLTDLIDRPAVCVLGDGSSFTSNHAADERTQNDAVKVGAMIAQRGWTLVVGGMHGLLAKVIEGAHSENGDVIVVTSKHLLPYNGKGAAVLRAGGASIRNIMVTEYLSERKAIQFALADAFITLPGGVNTFDAMFEAITLRQVGQPIIFRQGSSVHKPVFALNSGGFWNDIFKLIDNLEAAGFIGEKHREFLTIENNPDNIFALLDENLVKGNRWPERTWTEPQVGIMNQGLRLMRKLTRQTVYRAFSACAPEDISRALHEAKIEITNKPSPISELGCHPNVVVFCGSRSGVGGTETQDSPFQLYGKKLGRLIAENGGVLTYGGSMHGVMGSVADGALEVGGHVIAVTPTDFILGTSTAANEGFHPGIAATIAVPDMFKRKGMMSALSHGAVVLPGGYGTIEEMFEEVYLNVAGAHRKPTFVYNMNGLWDPMQRLLDTSIANGFMSETSMAAIDFISSPEEFEDAVRNNISAQIAERPHLDRPKRAVAAAHPRA